MSSFLFSPSEAARISRAHMLRVGGGGLGMAALSLLLPKPARAYEQSTLVHYTDGVGLVDQYGNIIVRTQHTLGGKSTAVLGQGYYFAIPITNIAWGTVFSFPGFSVSIPGPTGSFQLQNGETGGVSVPSQNGQPIYSWSPNYPNQVVATLQNLAPGKVCNKPPCPQTMNCTEAQIAYLVATVGLCAAFVAWVACPVDPIAAAALIAADASYEMEAGNMAAACGG